MLYFISNYLKYFYGCSFNNPTYTDVGCQDVDEKAHVSFLKSIAITTRSKECILTRDTVNGANLNYPAKKKGPLESLNLQERIHYLHYPIACSEWYSFSPSHPAPHSLLRKSPCLHPADRSLRSTPCPPQSSQSGPGSYRFTLNNYINWIYIYCNISQIHEDINLNKTKLKI